MIGPVDLAAEATPVVAEQVVLDLCHQAVGRAGQEGKLTGDAECDGIHGAGDLVAEVRDLRGRRRAVGVKRAGLLVDELLELVGCRAELVTIREVEVAPAQGGSSGGRGERTHLRRGLRCSGPRALPVDSHRGTDGRPFGFFSDLS